MAGLRLRAIMLSAMLLMACLNLPGAYGAEPWRVEFDLACEKTTDAMTLSIAELDLLIETCARLEKIIDLQDETVRKVYLRRLQMCRNMYVFARDAKQQQKQQK